MMKKVLFAAAAAILGGAILAGGSALADDYKRYKRGGLATGFTFCPVGDVAVFPATNVSRRPVWVNVSCVDGEGEEFGVFGTDDTGPVRQRIDPGEAVILAKACEAAVLGGELVRCTVMGRNTPLERIRGVLHICDAEADPDLELLGCDLTEALTFSSNDDDDDD